MYDNYSIPINKFQIIDIKRVLWCFNIRILAHNPNIIGKRFIPIDSFKTRKDSRLA